MAERRVVVVLDETVWRSLLVGWDSGPVREQMERAQSIDDPALVERVARALWRTHYDTDVAAYADWDSDDADLDEFRGVYRKNAERVLAVLSGEER